MKKNMKSIGHPMMKHSALIQSDMKDATIVRMIGMERMFSFTFCQPSVEPIAPPSSTIAAPAMATTALDAPMPAPAIDAATHIIMTASVKPTPYIRSEACR